MPDVREIGWPRRAAIVAVAAAVACSLAFPRPARAQQPSVAARVAAAPADASVRLSFPAREGVCGDGRRFISIGRSTITQDADVRRGDVIGDRGSCVPGPVRVVLERRGGEVRRVRTYVGGEAATIAPAADSATADVGAVDPTEAARWLLDLAARGDGRAAEQAILPAVLADRAVVWPALLAIARDSARAARHGTRASAALWLSRFAAAARAGHPGSLVTDDEERDEEGEKDVKAQAVFALAQLPRHQGIPELVTVARDNPDARVRSQAMFWLGQSGDPRAFALFEEILGKGK